MPAPAAKQGKTNQPKTNQPLPLGELDRVKLIRAVSDKDRILATGLTGTVMLCYGANAYEVEFDTIDGDFFHILAEDLAKI